MCLSESLSCLVCGCIQICCHSYFNFNKSLYSVALIDEKIIGEGLVFGHRGLQVHADLLHVPDCFKNIQEHVDGSFHFRDISNFYVCVCVCGWVGVCGWVRVGAGVYDQRMSDIIT